MADGNAAGAAGDLGVIGGAETACRDGLRAALGTLDLLAQLAEGGTGGRQAAIAARAAGDDVDAEIAQLSATRASAA